MTAELELLGGSGPRVSPFADAYDAAGLLQRAGFALPVADVDRVTVRYDHIFALMADLRAMGETSTLVEGAGRPLTRPVLARAAEVYAEQVRRAGRPPGRHLRDPDPDRLGPAREPAAAPAPRLGQDAPGRRAARQGTRRRREGGRLGSPRIPLVPANPGTLAGLLMQESQPSRLLWNHQGRPRALQRQSVTHFVRRLNMSRTARARFVILVSLVECSLSSRFLPEVPAFAGMSGMGSDQAAAFGLGPT